MREIPLLPAGWGSSAGTRVPEMDSNVHPVAGIVRCGSVLRRAAPAGHEVIVPGRSARPRHRDDTASGSRGKTLEGMAVSLTVSVQDAVQV